MTIDYEKLEKLERDITEIEKKLRIRNKKKYIENKIIRDSKSRLEGNTRKKRSTKKFKGPADQESQISFKL